MSNSSGEKEVNKTEKFWLFCYNWERENKHSNKYINLSDAAKVN